MRSALLLLALALTAGACSNTTEVVVEDTTSAKHVRLGERFTLRLGETALVAEDGTTIRFDRVAEDSRCPADVDCIREGEAYAHFTLQEDGVAPQPLRLEIAGFVTEVQDIERYQFQTAGRYVVALLLLQPYPGLAREAEMAPTATLEMRHLTR